jgi:hypothetical protein
LGQAAELTGVRKSWLRRLAVRCFEWRRFGLGIADFPSIRRAHAYDRAESRAQLLKFALLLMLIA